MADGHSFNNISLSGRGGTNPGLLKINSGGIQWKKQGGGKAVEVDKSDIVGVSWMKVPRTNQLGVKTKDGLYYKFTGFRDQDVASLTSFFQSAFGKTPEEKQLSVSGRNWGEVDLNGNNLTFLVGGKQAFEVSLADVSQTQLQGKNDVLLEFHVDDTAGANEKDSLTEISFHIPNSNTQFVGDETRPPAQVLHDRIMAVADVGAGVEEAVVTFEGIAILTPRGRYSVELHLSFLRLQGQANDFKIQYSSVVRVFLLPKGDFITSPEVSQMFGEMIGVWTVCLWEQMGKPERVNLIELGPGRGTLMVDLLRGTSKFRNFTESLHIHLVECSPALQKLQHQNLKCADEGSSEKKAVSSLAGTPVHWHSTLEEVPSGVPTIIIAHEFYDALPVHQFQKTPRGWCEKMVDVGEDSQFRFVLSPQPTPAALYLVKRCTWATPEEREKLEHVEISPKSMDLTQEIAKRIGSDGGGALIIDYGMDGIISDSLQAIREHKFVNILDDPGSADLSAYVDFPSIKHSAEEASENVSVHGPMTQSQFLGSLGINFRVDALLQNCDDEQAESLRSGYWRLVGDGEAPFWEGPDEQTPIGMGTRYLAIAIVNRNQGTPAPFQ